MEGILDSWRPCRRPRSASCIAVRQALFQLTRLSDFRAEKIGGGFFADVYKVEHTNTGEVMVLKMNKNRKNSKQMLYEIQLLNRLSHPNILGFRGSCVHEGQLHALTEYINGGTLEELLQRHSIQLSWRARIKIANDIANGMAYLHSKGVFHRDLTSKNCLIQYEPSGTIRTVVADFGLAAKIKDARGCSSHTEVVGSPYWMAPECLNGKTYCEKADVFSYGIILAEILARIPADPEFMPRTKQYGVDFEKLRKYCQNCPEELWDVMQQCSQIDPNIRPTFNGIVLSLAKVQSLDDDIRSSQSEPAISLDLEDSYSSSGTPELITPSCSNRWSAESLSAQGLADTVHPPHVAIEVTIKDEAAEDTHCGGTSQPYPSSKTSIRSFQSTAVNNLLPPSSFSTVAQDQICPRDCTPVLCSSPSTECQRLAVRTGKTGCLTHQRIPMARVHTAPELTSSATTTSSLTSPRHCSATTTSSFTSPHHCSATTTSSFTSPRHCSATTTSSFTSPRHCSATIPPCSIKDTMVTMQYESSPLESPSEHTTVDGGSQTQFNMVGTPPGILTSPLPPKSFRFSLEHSARLHSLTTSSPSAGHARLSSEFSDYGSGDFTSQSRSLLQDELQFSSLSSDARHRSYSSPSVKVQWNQSTHYTFPARCLSPDSSRSSLSSSSKCLDVRLRKNCNFSSAPSLISTYLQTHA